MNYFAPRMRPIPPPCGRNCPDRSGTCRAGCCTWTLYESIRNHIYDVNHRDRDSLQPDLAAGKQMVGQNHFSVSYGDQKVTVRAEDGYAALFTAAKHWGYKFTRPEYHQNARATKLHYTPDTRPGALV